MIHAVKARAEPVRGGRQAARSGGSAGWRRQAGGSDTPLGPRQAGQSGSEPPGGFFRDGLE
jgi:hypothetical protein